MILQRQLQLQNRSWVEVRVPEWFQHDLPSQRYEALFEFIDRNKLEREATNTNKRRGRLAHPTTAYIKAFMVMLVEKQSVSELRRYLREHPPLVWLLGFRVVPDTTSPYGFDVETTLPCERYLRLQLHRLDLYQLNEILKETIAVARELEPGLGEVVAIDVKHIYAAVAANNPKAYVRERFDPQQQPSTDPDCRLGLKRRYNQLDANGAKTDKAEWVWGYGSGIAVAQCLNREVMVLADYTQAFNEHDLSYAPLLLQSTSANLGFTPKHLTADAAFDAVCMYEGRPPDGIAAIPLNLRGKTHLQLDNNNQPLCEICGVGMKSRATWHEHEQMIQRFQCPTCGKKRKMVVEVGNLIRYRLDRASDLYHTIYRQRTAAERINSQAKTLGIERPQQRRQAAIERRNRLTYIVLNCLTLQRLHQRIMKTPPPQQVLLI